MEKIIERARNYKFHSLQYVIPNESIMVIEKNNYILIGEKDATKIKIHWACNSLESLLDGLNELSDKFKGKEITLQFVPPTFIKDLENEGYKVTCEFVDFWIKDLDKCNWNIPLTTSIRPLNKEETEIASSITKSCKGLSRGFYGEDEESISNWLTNKENKIFAAIQDEKIVGICMMATYNNKKEKVAWLRELAVHPKFQHKGIGRSLAKVGLEWGKNQGAKLSFLATDIENIHAINLYKKLGYKQNEGRGEIIISKHL